MLCIQSLVYNYSGLAAPPNKDIPASKNWRAISLSTDQLIAERKYAEAETVLRRIIPLAKKEAPHSFSFAGCFVRLATSLFEQKKFPQALVCVQEAQDIVAQNPSNDIGHRILLWCFVIKASALYRLKDFGQAEYSARKAIAYQIAFPKIATLEPMREAYNVLYWALGDENKSDEATKIFSILSTF